MANAFLCNKCPTPSMQTEFRHIRHFKELSPLSGGDQRSADEGSKKRMQTQRVLCVALTLRHGWRHHEHHRLAEQLLVEALGGLAPAAEPMRRQQRRHLRRLGMILPDERHRALLLKVGVQQTVLTQSTAAHFSLVRTVVSGSLSLVAKARLKLFLYITTVCKHWVPTWQ